MSFIPPITDGTPVGKKDDVQKGSLNGHSITVEKVESPRVDEGTPLTESQHVRPGNVEIMEPEINVIPLTDKEALAIFSWEVVDKVFNEIEKRISVCAFLCRCVDDATSEFNYFYQPFSSECNEGQRLTSTDIVEKLFSKLFVQRLVACIVLDNTKADGFSKDSLFKLIVNVKKYLAIVDLAIEQIALLYLRGKVNLLENVYLVDSVNNLPGSEYDLKCVILQIRHEVIRYMHKCDKVREHYSDLNHPEQEMLGCIMKRCKAALDVINKARGCFSKDAIFEAKCLFIKLLDAAPNAWIVQ